MRPIGAQLDLHANAEQYGKTVKMLSKQLDEEVARLHLAKLGVKLTELTKEQADYIGVPKDGPYKPEHYRVLTIGNARRPHRRSQIGGSPWRRRDATQLVEEVEEQDDRVRPRAARRRNGGREHEPFAVGMEVEHAVLAPRLKSPPLARARAGRGETRRRRP